MEVIDHIEVGVSDVEASRLFYEAALAPLGLLLVINVDATRTTRGTRRYGFGREGYPSFWIHEESGGRLPIHMALKAANQSQVDGFHAAAVSNGGINNGSPGIRERYHPRYYAAYVLDPDGNNIEAVSQSD